MGAESFDLFFAVAQNQLTADPLVDLLLISRE